MSDVLDTLLDTYNARLQERDICAYDVTTLKGKLGSHNLKFYPDGEAKSFHGLTCIAWVDRQSSLWQKLRSLGSSEI